MRASQFLFEYNRNITLRQTNIEKLMKAFKADGSLNIPERLEDFQVQVGSHYHPHYPTLTPDELINIAQEILVVIEELDPTSGNKFVPWLVRMYANGSVRFEDINRNNLLVYYEEGKKRNFVPVEYKDINKFKSYDLFEEMMYEFVLPKMEETQSVDKNINAEKVYEDSDVLVIVPKNEAAACKYGRGTRWCTAATQGRNYFDDYNMSGNLYILIPKKPNRDKEKYQLHFQSKSFMNEYDNPVSLRDIITVRFPHLQEFFLNRYPDLKFSMDFFEAVELEKLFNFIKQHAIKVVDKIKEKSQYTDKEYLKFLEYEGFVDQDGEIDWDRVEDSDYSYENFAEGYDEATKFIEDNLNPDGLWEEVRYSGLKDIRRLPTSMSEQLSWDLYRDKKISNHAYDIVAKVRNYFDAKRLSKLSNGKWTIT